MRISITSPFRISVLYTARASHVPINLRCSYSTTSTSTHTSELVTSEPQLLLRIRSDLKNAMRTKNVNRLNVVRGILAEITNFSKINKPVTTDGQVIAMLRSRAKLSKSAAADFGSAQRADLKEMEDAQIAVLEEYIGSVEMVTEDEIAKLAADSTKILESKGKGIKQGMVIKNLLNALDGRPVEMANVTRIVRDTVHEWQASRGS